MKTRIIVMGLAAILLVSVPPAFLQTYRSASNAHGLIILATLEDGEFTYNPYSNNGGFISPSVAMWMLNNLDYPYGRCSEAYEKICGIPLIMWAGRGIGLGSIEKDRKILRIITQLVSRGEPINVLHEGLSPLHEAIMFGSKEHLEILLESGADPMIKTSVPGKEWHGLTAFEYLHFIYSKKPGCCAELREVLMNHSGQL